ncbi:hypothetical protein LJC62_00675 [Odoribacter sp. OttesenSCG-928-A06]|nr:hypothetical protein [Odoribacter sp. OttesenSCG-928-A06]
MFNFSYKKSYKDISKEAYIPEKKVKRKQIFFSFVFFAFLVSLGAYVIYQLEVQTFEGYLMVRSRELRLADDAYIIKNRVKPGDVVRTGDTLFSYVLTGFFMDALNPINITSGQSEVNRLYLRSRELKAEANMYRNRVDSIQRIILKLEHEVNQGVETIKEVEEKRWEMFVAKEQIKRLEALSQTTTSAYVQAVGHIGGIAGNSHLPPPMYSVNFLNENEHIFGNSLLYGIASEDLLIVDAPSQAGTLVYKKEPVMTVLYTGSGHLMDMHALAFVSPKNIVDLKDQERVSVHVGNEVITMGDISLSVSRMFDVDPAKLGVLTQSGEAVAVRVNVDPEYPVHPKYQINNLPVRIKHRRGIIRKYFPIFFKE